MIDDVARGCAYLDVEVGKDWPYRIEIARLDLNNYDDCIIGQLSGRSFDAPYWDEHTGHEHGFMCNGLPRELEKLRAAWVNAIVARRSVDEGICA